MTKLSLSLPLLFVAVASVQSFAPHRQRFLCVQSATTKTTLWSTAADEYLDQCIEEWNQLEQDLQEVKETKDEMAAAELAENMLSKALNAVNAKKYVEFEHEKDANAKIKEASDREIFAQEVLKKAHNDAEAAQTRVDMLEGSIDDTVYEDNERRRDLSVVHSAHHVEKDAAKVLKNAHDAANSAIGDLMDAQGQLTVLEVNEENLRLALKELHQAKKVYAMTHWHNNDNIDHEYFDNLYWKYTM